MKEDERQEGWWKTWKRGGRVGRRQAAGKVAEGIRRSVGSEKRGVKG